MKLDDVFLKLIKDFNFSEKEYLLVKAVFDGLAPTIERKCQRIYELEAVLKAKNDLIANMDRELRDLRYLGGL